LPVVASLRRAWPESRIAWAIQPGPHRLMRGHPAVERFLLFRRELGMRALGDFRRQVRPLRFDLVLDCHRHFKAGLVTWMADAPVKLGFDRRRARDFTWLFTTHRLPAREPGHVQEGYFEFLEYLGVPVVREWDFHFTEEEEAARRAFFTRLGAPGLAVVLRSSRPEKDWTLEGFARVLEMAVDLGLRPLLVGGRTAPEERAAAELRAVCRAPVEDARADDPRRLAWLLAGSAVALAPDTGPLHIAVALGTPTVGLYGATDPRRSGPYERFGELLVDRYPARGARRPSPRVRPEGMRRITVSEVGEKLELAVRRYVREPGSATRGGSGPTGARNEH
ncbi:MAG: glycosyltransferase family 9 protein, partial [Gemmatimonadota bacterium]